MLGNNLFSTWCMLIIHQVPVDSSRLIEKKEGVIMCDEYSYVARVAKRDLERKLRKENKRQKEKKEGESIKSKPEKQ